MAGIIGAGADVEERLGGMLPLVGEVPHIDMIEHLGATVARAVNAADEPAGFQSAIPENEANGKPAPLGKPWKPASDVANPSVF